MQDFSGRKTTPSQRGRPDRAHRGWIPVLCRSWSMVRDRDEPESDQGESSIVPDSPSSPMDPRWENQLVPRSLRRSYHRREEFHSRDHEVRRSRGCAREDAGHPSEFPADQAVPHLRNACPGREPRKAMASFRKDSTSGLDSSPLRSGAPRSASDRNARGAVRCHRHGRSDNASTAGPSVRASVLQHDRAMVQGPFRSRSGSNHEDRAPMVRKE